MLDKQDMPAQPAGTPKPRAVGIDEISIRKGHSYLNVVSDLGRAGRPRSTVAFDTEVV